MSVARVYFHCTRLLLLQYLEYLGHIFPHFWSKIICNSNSRLSLHQNIQDALPIFQTQIQTLTVGIDSNIYAPPKNRLEYADFLDMEFLNSF